MSISRNRILELIPKYTEGIKLNLVEIGACANELENLKKLENLPSPIIYNTNVREKSKVPHTRAMLEHQNNIKPQNKLKLKSSN